MLQTNNIFFAFTPLHLKIVNSIPKKDNSILIILSKKNLSPFYNSYIDEDEFLDVYKYQSRFFNPIELLRINFKYKNINKVYVGNFKFFNFRLIELCINYQKLVTFDDGVGGITENYFHLNNTTLKEYFYSIFKLNIANIMKKHEFHYGIYSAKGSTFKNKIRSLELEIVKKRFFYDGNVLLTTDKSEVGTMSEEDELKLLQKIVKQLNIKYILHHPAKRLNLNILNAIIINEPYLADDIVSNSSFSYTYSLSASSILGILQVNIFPKKNITYLANRDAPVMKKLKSEMNINTINFEDL